MATREALEAGRRLHRAGLAMLNAIRFMPLADQDRALAAFKVFERAAIKVGEVRERNRKQKAVR